MYQSSDSDTYEKYLCAMNLGNNALKYDVLKKMWFSEKERQQYKVQKGDLIVVEGGDVASCDIVKEDVSDLYIQNALHRVRAKKDFTLEFLRYSLMMAKAQVYFFDLQQSHYCTFHQGQVFLFAIFGCSCRRAIEDRAGSR